LKAGPHVRTKTTIKGRGKKPKEKKTRNCSRNKKPNGGRTRKGISVVKRRTQRMNEAKEKRKQSRHRRENGARHLKKNVKEKNEKALSNAKFPPHGRIGFVHYNTLPAEKTNQIKGHVVLIITVDPERKTKNTVGEKTGEITKGKRRTPECQIKPSPRGQGGGFLAIACEKPVLGGYHGYPPRIGAPGNQNPGKGGGGSF